MTDKPIIFAKPVYRYDTYYDFYKLAELSGFPIVSVSDIDITKDVIYITAPMNGDYKEHFVGNLKHWENTGELSPNGQLVRQKISGMHRHAHCIVWNLERPSGSGSVPQYAQESFNWITNRFCDDVWVSDAQLADETMLQYVVLGSHPGLGEPDWRNKHYDFTHQSSTGVRHAARRVNIYKEFQNIGPNAWPWNDPSRDYILKSSKFALNIHQDNFPYVEPLRFALFAAYGLPIISENVASNFPYGDDLITHGYHEIVQALKVALQDDYEPWKERGLRLRKKLCEDLQFGKMVRKAVNESVGIGWR